MQVKLKKDIVIPAGTVFHNAPVRSERSPLHVEHILGLTKDSTGSLIYFLEPLDQTLAEYFEVLEASPYERQGWIDEALRGETAHI